jgi:hypothetical protein
MCELKAVMATHFHRSAAEPDLAIDGTVERRHLHVHDPRI